MENLIDSLGADYCNQRVAGALFVLEGNAYMFQAVRWNEAGTALVVAAQKYSGTPEKQVVEIVELSPKVFTGWSSLSFPTLGYRQAAAGQVLMYLSRSNSVNRGLNWRDIRVSMHDVSYACEAAFGIELARFTQGTTLNVMTLLPTYTPLMEGIAAVRAGKMPAFAVSADFAVAPVHDVPFLEILYRQRRVGTIDAEGKISLDVPGLHPLWDKTTKESTP